MFRTQVDEVSIGLEGCVKSAKTTKWWTPFAFTHFQVHLTNFQDVYESCYVEIIETITLTCLGKKINY